MAQKSSAAPQRRIPSYRLHRPSGRAVVTLNGRDHYLGPHGTPESRQAYDRLIAQWLSVHGSDVDPSPDLSIDELLLAYLRFAENYYRDADGNVTLEVQRLKNTFRLLQSLYGATDASAFGPKALKAVRQKMLEQGLCRTLVNARVGQIKRLFRWASSEQLVPATTYHGLLCVEGLKRGRCAAAEPPPVLPVADANVDAALPYMCPTLRAMVELQRLTGMRSGELVLLRGADLDRSGPVWLYRPARHKTAHLGHARVVPLGPQAQGVLQPFLDLAPDDYCFSPRQSMRERNEMKRSLRKSKVQPSQVGRRKLKPNRSPSDRYDTKSYYRAVQYALIKARATGASVPHWHPHQLRHTAATKIRKQHGLDAARAVLGHKSLAATDTYAELDTELASTVAATAG